MEFPNIMEILKTHNTHGNFHQIMKCMEIPKTTMRHMEIRIHPKIMRYMEILKILHGTNENSDFPQMEIIKTIMEYMEIP